MHSRASILYDLVREFHTVFEAADVLPAVSAFGINPGDAINDKQVLNVIPHSSASLDETPVGPISSFGSVPYHQLLFS
jgi:hypothetical protein